jgi:hypothetical protein
MRLCRISFMPNKSGTPKAGPQMAGLESRRRYPGVIGMLNVTLGKFGVTVVAIVQLLSVSNAVAAELDRVCWKSFAPDPKTGIEEDVCEILTLEKGKVIYVEPGIRRPALGAYVRVAQRFVPGTEAPIRDLQSPRGWHIVVSSVLQKEDSPRLRVRFFGPDGNLRATGEVLMTLEGIEVGRLFGGTDDIFAIQSSEEHSYNSMISVWLLPERGEPHQLIEENATQGKFSKRGKGNRPGVWINRQTYDGVHAETKGWVGEFWIWDTEKKSLNREKK